MKLAKALTAIFIFTALQSCKPQGDTTSNSDEYKFVPWPIADLGNEKGYISGSDLKAVIEKIEAKNITKDQFETTQQFRTRSEKMAQASQIGGFDFRKNYVFSNLANWKYDADTQTLTIEGDYDGFSNADLGSYEASNAFGAKVTVKRSINSWIYQHFFLPGELPCYCYDGQNEEPLGKTRGQKMCSEVRNGPLAEIKIKVGPERARKIGKYVQILTVENFDTRDLLATQGKLCSLKTTTESTKPTITSPTDEITITKDVNAKLLRLIVRNDETGDIFATFDYSPNK